MRETLVLREIRVRLIRQSWPSVELRLWTSLLDPRQGLALELALLYARRWGHELYWRQMKLDLRKNEVLASC